MKRVLLGVAALVAACSNSSSDDDSVDVDGGTSQPDAATVVCGATTCDEPPPAVCVDAFTLRVSLDDGACAGDACQFTTDDFVCPFGCTGGACNAYTCTPNCPSNTCVPDGCGGMCGACTSGATFPGFTPSLIGSSADSLVLSPDGAHLAITRNLAPPPPCGWRAADVGRLDVYTFAASGQATRRIVGRQVALGTVRFDGDVMIYLDDVEACHGRGDLWVARADGSQPRRIATRVFGAEVYDGVAFWHRPDPDDIDQSTYDGHVYAASLALGVPRQLAVDDYGTWALPSPDGSAVVTSGNAAQTSIGRVTVTDVATGVSRALTPSSWSMKYKGPWWSPDGDRLFFLQSTSGYAPWTLTMVNEDGTGRVDLTTDAATDSYDLPFTSDGARVAFVERTASGTQDIVVRTLATGATARLTGAVTAGSGYVVWRLAFNRSDASVLAIVGPPSGSDSRPFRLMRGPASGGALATLVDPLGLDGQAFDTVTRETASGQLAVMGTDATKIITPAGVVTTIAGVPYEGPVFDAAGQRVLVDTTRSMLRVFPASGAGTGTVLASYRSVSALASEALGRYVPFIFGWWGSLALYPSNVYGSYPYVQQDLRAWDETRSGVIGTRVTRYAVAADRIVFQTTDGAVFAGRRP